MSYYVIRCSTARFDSPIILLTMIAITTIAYLLACSLLLGGRMI